MTGDRRRELADQWRDGVRRWLKPADRWRAKVQGWVDEGIVSSAQGEEILARETSESDTSAPTGLAPQPSLSPSAELLSYFGVVVVALASVLFLGHYWSGLVVAGRVSVAMMVCVAGLLGAYVVAQIGDARARRLSGFLRLLATAGAALATANAVSAKAEGHRGLTLLCVGLVVLALGASLWRNLDRPLQFLSTLLGVALTLSAVGTVARLHATSTEVSMLVWLLAVAVGLMSLQMLRPAATAFVVAELGAFVGAMALSFPNHFAGVLLGLATTLSAVAIGFVLERPTVIVLGAMGFFMFDFRIFSIYLRSAEAALGAFILGLVLVLVALWRALVSERRETASKVELQLGAEWYEPW